MIPILPISKSDSFPQEPLKVPSASVIFKEPEEKPVVDNRYTRSVFEQEVDESSLFTDRTTTTASSKLNKLFEQLGEKEPRPTGSTRDIPRPTIFEEEATTNTPDISSILNSQFARKKTEFKESDTNQGAKLNRLPTLQLFGEEETEKPTPSQLPFQVEPDTMEEIPQRPTKAMKKSIFEEEEPQRPSKAMKKSIFEEEEPQKHSKAIKKSVFQEEEPLPLPLPPKTSNIKSVFDSEPTKSSVIDTPPVNRKSIFDEDPLLPPSKSSKSTKSTKSILKDSSPPSRKSIFDEEDVSSLPKDTKKPQNDSKSKNSSLLQNTSRSVLSSKPKERMSKSIFEEEEEDSFSFQPKLKHSASTIQPPTSKKGSSKMQIGRNTIFETDEEDSKFPKQASVKGPAKANPRSRLFESSDEEEDVRRRPKANAKTGKSSRSVLFDD